MRAPDKQPTRGQSVEMASCERSTGSGFQILLEAGGVRLVRELHDDVSPPRAVLCRMRAVSLVMPGQPLLHVARHPDVITRCALWRLEHVDESLRRHPARGGKFIASRNPPDFEPATLGGVRSARFLRRPGPEWIAEFGDPPPPLRRDSLRVAWGVRLRRCAATARQPSRGLGSASAAGRLRRDSLRVACRAEAHASA